MTQNRNNNNNNNTRGRNRRRFRNKRPKYVQVSQHDGNNNTSSTSTLSLTTPLALLQWARKHRHVLVQEKTVPAAISGEGNGKPALTLHDMRINTRRSRRGGALEDELYARDAELQKYITRGLTVLQVGNNDDDESTFHLVTRGFRKFYGLDEQDEDTKMDEQEGEEQDQDQEVPDSELERQKSEDDARQLELLKAILPDDTATIVSQCKENGEACHMSAISIGDDHYWIMGSKNVHLLARQPSDLEHYPEPRFQFARTMAESLMQPGDGVDLEGWRKHLIDNQLTANFEFLQSANQHVEPFDFVGTRLKFLTFTSNKLDFSMPICDDPQKAGAVVKKFGWDYAEVEVAPIQELLVMLRKTRDMYRKEGSVFYFLDSHGAVVDMKKVKAIWYVLVRCIREKVRGVAYQKDPDIPKIKSQMRKTIKQRQSWLKYCNAVRQKWSDMGAQCIDWVGKKRSSGNFSREGMDQFPELWLKFLSDCNLEDHVYPVNISQ